MSHANVPLRLFPQPKRSARLDGEFCFGKKVCLHISRSQYDGEQFRLFRELFSNFCCGCSSIKVIFHDCTAHTAVLSMQEQGISLPEPDAAPGDWDYRLLIDKEKAIMTFHDCASLAHAFCTLLSLTEVRCTDSGRELCTLPVCEIEDKPAIVMRAIHVCVFPELRYVMLKKFIRLIGFAKYSHVVLEFWGTFKYKCCPDMYGKGALSARKVRALVREAHAFGLEVIPMLNLLGHAAQSRAIFCKHTTLDKNPKLAPLFEPDGWTWNILNPDTLALLKKMRAELIDACGQGKYFHMGCDEAFPYASSRLFDGKDKSEELCRYLNGICEELSAQGRRGILWGDQLLYGPERFKGCIAYGESQETTEKLLAGLDRRILIADWQYYYSHPAIPSARFFREQGFDVLLAPFDNVDAVRACAGDVVSCGYQGFLQTTWDLMHGQDFRMILRGASFAWQGDVNWTKENIEFMGFEMCSYQRRLLPSRGNYRNSGIREKQIEI